MILNCLKILLTGKYVFIFRWSKFIFESLFLLFPINKTFANTNSEHLFRPCALIYYLYLLNKHGRPWLCVYLKLCRPTYLKPKVLTCLNKFPVWFNIVLQEQTVLLCISSFGRCWPRIFKSCSQKWNFAGSLMVPDENAIFILVCMFQPRSVGSGVKGLLEVSKSQKIVLNQYSKK